jgi:hypothetical protein
MITDKQKEDIFLKIAPFELYYYHDDMVMKYAHAGTIRSLSNNFETEESFVIAVNEVLNLNSILFFNMVSKHNLSKEAFIDYVSTRYNVFKENSNGNGLTDWLNYTKKLIFDKELKYYIKEVSTTNKGAFLNWYNDINKTLPGVKTDVDKPKPKPKQVKKPDAIFTDWVNLNTLELKEQFAQDFKIQIQGLASSNLSIAINLLEIDRILIIPKTDKPSFLASLEKYLGRNIGTRQGFSNKNDNKAKKTPIEETIKPLITKYKWKIGKI